MQMIHFSKNQTAKPNLTLDPIAYTIEGAIPNNFLKAT
jgi:hypothetical protein